MSLIPTYVRASDGRWYEDPTLAASEDWRERKWFLCFDDDDPPELVVRTDTYGGDPVVDPNPILESLNAKVVRDGDCSYRWFGPIGEDEGQPAKSAFVRFLGPLDPAYVMECEKIYDEQPGGEGVFYDLSGFKEEVDA